MPRTQQALNKCYGYCCCYYYSSLPQQRRCGLLTERSEEEILFPFSELLFSQITESGRRSELANQSTPILGLRSRGKQGTKVQPVRPPLGGADELRESSEVTFPRNAEESREGERGGLGDAF